MSTFRLPLERIDARTLDSLRAEAVAEDRQLDYKEQLPPEGDDRVAREAKREFLCDISSFANSVGGDLIYGVRGARDGDGVPTGTPEAVVGLPGVNLDQAQLRLDSLLQHGVDPRIPGVRFQPISHGSEPPCLVIRVPQSPLRLHMVTYQRYGFYARGASGRYQLDVRQIRAGFLEVETAQERVRRFRLDRVARVLAGETPVPIGAGSTLIFHALPLTQLDVWPTFLTLADDVSRIVSTNLLLPLDGSPGNWRYNLAGFVIHTSRHDKSRDTYTQLFRDAGIEAAGAILSFSKDRRGFYGRAMEDATIPPSRGLNSFGSCLE